MERFVGKVAVVTGTSSGIGRAIAKEFSRRGLIVVGLARNMEKQQELANEISENPDVYSGKFHPMKCDVSQEKEIHDTFAHIKAKIGPITVLVNNAVMLGKVEKISETTGDHFDMMFKTNTKSVLLCSQEAMQSMNNHSIEGHIININSISSLSEFNAEFRVLATATKCAMRTITRGLRREVQEKKQNIKISTISPGVTDTEGLQKVESAFPVNLNDRILPDDIANACIAILDTRPNVLMTEVTIVPIHSPIQ